MKFIFRIETDRKVSHFDVLGLSFLFHTSVKRRIQLTSSPLNFRCHHLSRTKPNTTLQNHTVGSIMRCRPCRLHFRYLPLDIIQGKLFFVVLQCKGDICMVTAGRTYRRPYEAVSRSQPPAGRYCYSVEKDSANYGVWTYIVHEGGGGDEGDDRVARRCITALNG